MLLKKNNLAKNKQKTLLFTECFLIKKILFLFYLTCVILKMIKIELPILLTKAEKYDIFISYFCPLVIFLEKKNVCRKQRKFFPCSFCKWYSWSGASCRWAAVIISFCFCFRPVWFITPGIFYYKKMANDVANIKIKKQLLSLNP